MRITQTALRAGIAAVAAVGFAGMAAAQTPQTHVITFALPNTNGVFSSETTGVASRANRMYFGPLVL